MDSQTVNGLLERTSEIGKVVNGLRTSLRTRTSPKFRNNGILVADN